LEKVDQQLKSDSLIILENSTETINNLKRRINGLIDIIFKGLFSCGKDAGNNQSETSFIIITRNFESVYKSTLEKVDQQLKSDSLIILENSTETINNLKRRINGLIDIIFKGLFSCGKDAGNNQSETSFIIISRNLEKLAVNHRMLKEPDVHTTLSAFFSKVFQNIRNSSSTDLKVLLYLIHNSDGRVKKFQKPVSEIVKEVEKQTLENMVATFDEKQRRGSRGVGRSTQSSAASSSTPRKSVGKKRKAEIADQKKMDSINKKLKVKNNPYFLSNELKTNLCEVDENKQFMLFFSFNEISESQYYEIMLHEYSSLSDKILQLKDARIILMAKYLDSSFFKSTKADGFCGYRIVKQLFNKHLLSFDENDSDKKEYSKRFKNLDTDLNTASGRAEFIEFLTNRIISFNDDDDSKASKQLNQKLEAVIKLLSEQAENAIDIHLDPNLWLQPELLPIFMPDIIEYNLFAKKEFMFNHERVEMFDHVKKMEKNGDLKDWCFLSYCSTNSGNKSYSIESMTYSEAANAVKNNNNIYFSGSQEDFAGSHYFTAGSFASISIKNLDKLFVDFLFKVLNPFENNITFNYNEIEEAFNKTNHRKRIMKTKIENVTIKETLSASSVFDLQFKTIEINKEITTDLLVEDNKFEIKKFNSKSEEKNVVAAAPSSIDEALLAVVETELKQTDIVSDSSEQNTVATKGSLVDNKFNESSTDGIDTEIENEFKTIDTVNENKKDLQLDLDDFNEISIDMLEDEENKKKIVNSYNKLKKQLEDYKTAQDERIKTVVEVKEKVKASAINAIERRAYKVEGEAEEVIDLSVELINKLEKANNELRKDNAFKDEELSKLKNKLDEVEKKISPTKKPPFVKKPLNNSKKK
jgi:hypothetical protein